MKRVILLLLILLFSSVATTAYAEDVLIIHQGYGNTASKWKNRLEDAGHTVTSVNTSSSSFPSSTTSYEQIYDIRYTNTHALTTSQKNAYQALLARGGTLFLNTENPHSNHQTRNTGIATFITSLGAGTVTYSSSYAGNGTQWNTTHSYVDGMSGTLTMPAAGTFSALGNGDWLVKDADGDVVAAVWYGEDLDNAYSDGIIFVFTDINYASHSSYYTNNNKAFMNALRTALASTFNQPTSAVTISAGQTTKRTAAMNASIENGCNVCIVQSGDNPTINIQQDGNNNFIVDKDWSGPATLTGDNLALTIKQGNVTTTGSSDENGIGLYINGNNTNLTINQGDHANDQGEHKMVIDINGASNVMNLTQYDGGTLSKHFFEADIDGGSNNFTVTQKDNGQKTMFLDVNGNSNQGTFIQEDTGTHYLDVTLDADHDVDITQRGSGNHGARVNLDGHSTDFDLIQQGSSAQYYNLDNTCSNALGCTISTTQGTQ
jgi:hypothetical protein